MKKRVIGDGPTQRQLAYLGMLQGYFPDEPHSMPATKQEAADMIDGLTGQYESDLMHNGWVPDVVEYAGDR